MHCKAQRLSLSKTEIIFVIFLVVFICKLLLLLLLHLSFHECVLYLLFLTAARISLPVKAQIRTD